MIAESYMQNYLRVREKLQFLMEYGFRRPVSPCVFTKLQIFQN